jgi:hypothetical protein
MLMDENQDVRLWDQKEGEPARWYHIFTQYYLGAGFRRSVRQAWLNFVKENDGEEAWKEVVHASPPSEWYQMSVRWQWYDRAEAWEEEQTELSMAAVSEGAKLLRLHTVDAVKALILALTSEKFAVQAAKEILDRGGLPSTSKIDATGAVLFTADDMAKAQEELNNWRRERESDENG